jgi:hypothetical protein
MSYSTETVGRPLPRQWIIGKILVDEQFTETKKVVNSRKQNKPCK